jgi:hypothetical protein
VFGYFRYLRRLSQLEEQFATLKRAVEEHDLDWTDMRARCKRLLDRTEKAARRVESEDVGEVQETAIVPSNGAGTSPGRLLTPHQREVQQQILKRRAGG